MRLCILKRKHVEALKQNENCFRICCALLLAISLLTTFSLSGCAKFSPKTEKHKATPAGHEEDPAPRSNVSQETGVTEEDAKADGEELHAVVVEKESFLLIRREPGVKNKPTNDVIVRVPGERYLKVINKHENKISVDDFIWWEVEDPLLGISGWVAENYLRADAISLETIYQAPFSNDEIFAAGAKLGMKEHEVIQAIGEPVNKKSGCYEGLEENYLTMEYPFGELTFIEACDDSYYWLYCIEVNKHKEGATGPRNIQVGDSCHEVLEKFPNKDGAGHYSDKTEEILYGEYMYGTANGVAFYENQELSEIILATDEFLGLKIAIENGVVSHFTLFVQIT